jgi:hypothetical protein
LDAKNLLFLNHGLTPHQLLPTGDKRTKTGKLILADGRALIAFINPTQLAHLLDAKLPQLFTHQLILFLSIKSILERIINTGKMMINGELSLKLDQCQLALPLDAKNLLFPNHGLTPLQLLPTGDKRTKTGKLIPVDGKAPTALSNWINNLDQLAPLSSANLEPLLSISTHQTRKSKITMFQTSALIRKSSLPSNTSKRLRPNSELGI